MQQIGDKVKISHEEWCKLTGAKVLHPKRTEEEIEIQKEHERRLDIPYLKRPSIRWSMRELLARDFLNNVEWQIYFHLTFKPGQETKSIYTCMTRVDRFRKIMHEKFCMEKREDWFVALEPHKSGWLHIHGLQNNHPKDIPKELIKAIWDKKYGFSRVLDFEKEKGAEYYLTKYMLKEPAWWDFHFREQRPDDNEEFERWLRKRKK